MSVFDTITALQGKERTAVWMCGEQLKEIIRNDPAAQDIVAQDLTVAEMSLANCEKKIKEYADKHKTGSFACVLPHEAEKIIREFYGLDPKSAAPEPVMTKTVELSDFF